MKCHIPGLNVKIISCTVHALARVGDELYIEALQNALIFRTINSAETSYAMVKFDRSFFFHYRHDHYSTENSDTLKCKISMKSALTVFKSPVRLEKQVDSLEIKLDPEASSLIFEMRCKQGITKTHYVLMLDYKAMEANYAKDTVPNRLSFSYNCLSEVLSSFQSSDDQVTIEVSPQILLIRNYISHTVDVGKMNRTQTSLKPAEFSTYIIGGDTNITFTTKEFKSILNFAKVLKLAVSLNFETTGRPAVFVIHNDSTFEAHFVLSTSKANGCTQTNSTQNTLAEENLSKRRHSDLLGMHDNTATKKPHLEMDYQDSKCLDEDDHLFNFVEMPAMESNRTTEDKLTDISKSRNISTGDISRHTIFNETNGDSHLENSNTDYESIPASPTSKVIIKNVFKRCFEATFDPTRLKKRILVYNSDSD